MAEEEKASAAAAVESENKETSKEVTKKKSKGILSRMWNTMFRVGKVDFEKRLEHISKEEAAVLSRMKRRSITRRRMSRNLIIFSVIFEVIAVGYAIITARSVGLDWKMRTFRVLPMLLLPCLSLLAYSALMNLIQMRDRKDQKTLERLRAERQAKIDELKERTNYYITQQLIQKYDTDPAAKAAAATVLASKLGADSGLKVFVGDEPQLHTAAGKSNDVELVEASGLHNRRRAQSRSTTGMGNPVQHHNEERVHSAFSEVSESTDHKQLVVEHQNPQAASAYDGGWIARIAALLVGDDPAQSYALICGNCHMHNGLAKKEDFPYVTYYCPHCHALNQSKHSLNHVSGSNTPKLNPSTTTSAVEPVSEGSRSPAEAAARETSPIKDGDDIEEVTESVAAASELASKTDADEHK